MWALLCRMVPQRGRGASSQPVPPGLRGGWLEAGIHLCCEVQKKGTLPQKIKPTGQVFELPAQASCHHHRGRDERDGTGKLRPPRGAEAGQAHGFGVKEDERAPGVTQRALEKEETLS